MKIKMSVDFKGLFQSIKQTLTVYRLKKAVLGSIEGATIYLAYFIVSEIVISGGRYEQNIFLEIASLMIVAALSTYYVVRRTGLDETTAIKEGFGNLTVFALLDFLLNNLLLDANSGQIYKYWGTLVIYAVVLITPYVVLQIRKKRMVAEPVEIS